MTAQLLSSGNAAAAENTGRDAPLKQCRGCKAKSGCSRRGSIVSRAIPSRLNEEVDTLVSTDQFREEIRSRLNQAAARQANDLIIDAKELYRALCKRPVVNRWMIFCCNAMRAEMTDADNLIFDYANDTLLTINYKLPRNSHT
jgi:hypothetical protein